MSAKTTKIFYLDDLTIPFSASDKTVLEAVLKQGEFLEYSCGGNGTCGTCLVELLPGQAALAPASGEIDFRQERPLKDSERLACQMPCQEQLRLRRP